MVWEAFFYQIAKDAGAMAAVLHGKVDQIILTGGIAYNPFTAKTLTEYLGWIAPYHRLSRRGRAARPLPGRSPRHDRRGRG